MISIVVPVYKVEKWLGSCLDSILGQDFCDFELILVDDGSPDNCGAICDEYAKTDNRIRVIHQKNRGLSAARNAGTKVARGEYLTFVDSDDVLYPDYLSTLFGLLEEKKADISVIDVMHFHDTLPERTAPDRAAEVLTGEKACERLFSEHEILMIMATGKLYRREKTGDPVYPEGKLHEDEFVTYRLMANAQKVVISGIKCYGYRMRDDGITGAAWTPKRLDRLTALEEAPEFLLNKGFERAALMARKRYLLNIEISSCQCGKKTEETYGIRRKLVLKHREYLKKYRKEIIPVCSMMEKITIRIFCISPGLYDFCAHLFLNMNKGNS